MKKIFYLMMIPALISAVSCGGKKDQDKKTGTVAPKDSNLVNVEKEKRALMLTDSLFSAFSAKNGSSEAFINYIADDGILLRPNHRPIVGKDSVTQLMNKKKKKNITMTWTPMYAEVARSGDMGFTYGIYTASVPGLLGKPQIEKGTYVSIWEKDSSGHWKLALDSGNEGIDQKAKAPKQK
jgi:ketosteroid isomerase-like protein